MNKEIKKRDGRIPLHKQKRIGIKTEPGMATRLVTDKDGRVSRFMQAGWTPMHKEVLDGKTPSGKPSQEGNIAMQDVGGGDKAYYMQIPEKFYNQDQTEKQKRCDNIMEQIGIKQKGMLTGIPRKQRYTNNEGTTTGVKVEHSFKTEEL
jgi:hypothetical protein